MRGSGTIAYALIPFTAASQLVWPSKWDEIEDLSTMMSGYGKRGFMDAVVTCTFGTNEQGRQNSAEWIRTAFHDAITHDAKAGTGGLDASIYWETDRPENPGAAFKNTFSFFSGFHNRRATASDLTALGVVVATGACAGPKIPFRAGRIDAYKAGPQGVPEPSTNLQETFAAFTKAGFTKQDMTAMVACGHALGGVHSVDFPDVTSIEADPKNDTSVPFQKDISSFHNGVVTEYLAGVSKNPLVVATNKTLNSDKRIFDNDKATMKKLSTKAGFDSKCRDIFVRMIDTVPKNVKLTSVIDSYDVKPYITQMSLTSKGKINFKGSIRMKTTQGVGRNANDLAVKLVYTDRSGKSNLTVPTTRGMWQSGLTSGLHDEFVSFEFDTLIDAKAGISKFWIQEITPSTKTTKLHDNQNTGGYKVDDTVLYQIPQSCFDIEKLTTGAAPMSITAMVRDARAKDTMTLRVSNKVGIKGVDVPKFQTNVVTFKATGKRQSGFTAFQAKATTKDRTAMFDIVLHGKEDTSVEFQSLGNLPAKCG